MTPKSPLSISTSRAIIRSGPESHQLDIASRDWGLLRGPLFAEGQPFIDALGVYEHFTVAAGVPEGSQVARQQLLVLDATQSLLRALQRDEELLCFDYTFSFSAGDGSRGAGRRDGFLVRGLTGSISTRPHGYCCLTLTQLGPNRALRVVELIDMRIRESIETDDLGVLKIHRRKAEMHWLARLPPLIEFLTATSERAVTIEHHERAT